MRRSQILSQYADADLSEPEVSPGGDGVSFPHTYLVFTTCVLVAPFPPKSTLPKRAGFILDQAHGHSKTQAFRSNSANGGRQCSLA